MNREYHRWYSTRLGREMEVLLFGHTGEPILWLPTLRGRFFEAEDAGLVHALGDRLQAGRYVLVCADSVDAESWTNRGAAPPERLARHAAYESYLVEEVVPLLMGRSTGGRLTLAGAGFGGFHTYNVGLRYPNLFRRLLSLGTRFEPDAFLDGYEGLDAYFHAAVRWLPNLSDPAQLAALRRVEMILAVGERDEARESNERLSKLLWRKDIVNYLSVWAGLGHAWPAWHRMAEHHLPW